MHWWDRVRVGLFVEVDVERLNEQVVFDTLTTTRSSKITNEIKKALATREAELIRQL